MNKKMIVKTAKISLLALGTAIFMIAMLHVWFPIRSCKELHDQAWPLRWVDPTHC